MSAAPASLAYLDNAATTPMRPEAIAAMLPFLAGEFANPSGTYAPARRARRAVDDARDQFAAALGCLPGEVVFTSGGTEADNLAVQGVARRRGGSIVVSAVEHQAVLRPARALGARVAPVGPDGIVDLDALGALLDRDVGLVSVMAVNSEIGVVQPIEAVVALVRERAPAALVHCDAVQALPWLDVAARCRDCDLVSVSAHKFGGPKGVGALVVRHAGLREVCAPLLLGGGQERELRPGTENVAGIVAAGVAAASTVAERSVAVPRIAALRDRLVDGLLAAHPGAAEPAARALRVAGSAHLRFSGVDAEELLFLLDEVGVCASMGAACASGAREPSHVLLAMGWSRAQARSALRLSLGWATAMAEIDATLEVLPPLLARLAAATPAPAEATGR